MKYQHSKNNKRQLKPTYIDSKYWQNKYVCVPPDTCVTSSPI